MHDRFLLPFSIDLEANLLLRGSNSKSNLNAEQTKIIKKFLMRTFLCLHNVISLVFFKSFTRVGNPTVLLYL